MILSKIKKRLLTGLVVLIMAGSGTLALPLFLPRFGMLPSGARLERIKASPNYAGGEFRNLFPTTMFAEDQNHISVMWKFLFGEKAHRSPPRPLPVVKTDLAALPPDRDVVVWLGHSSLYLQISGKHILMDPVFSDHAAPFSFMTRAFSGEYPYTAGDVPEIDCLVISHDHWDHLDYATLTALMPKIRAVVCPLGVGAHLERWGFAPEIIHEGDWDESVALAPDFTVHVLPTRHFSGRWVSRNKTLWAAFMFETPARRVFYSGDGGYGPHLVQIGERFGVIDLAIMENGQYDPAWASIHMMPEEVAQAAGDVRARMLLPVHSGRFTISNHDWDDPYKRILAAGQGKDFKLLTPMMGQPAWLDGNPGQTFTPWWEEVLR